MQANHQGIIDEMLLQRASFEEIEERIENMQADADLKSALWLLAWVETDRSARRRVVRSMELLHS